MRAGWSCVCGGGEAPCLEVSIVCESVCGQVGRHGLRDFCSTCLVRVLSFSYAHVVEKALHGDIREGTQALG